MGCASSRAADARPLCARCHHPVGAQLPTGRYICHRCGRETTPLFPNSAVGPRRSGGANSPRPLPSTPPATSDGVQREASTCRVCRSQLPLGVVNCPYCGNLLGASASRPPGFGRSETGANRNRKVRARTAARPDEFGRAEDATNGNRNVWARAAAEMSRSPHNTRDIALEDGDRNVGDRAAVEMSRSPPAARDIALEDSDEALERLTNLLGPDRSTLRKILRNLGDNAPKFWPCPDCTFHNPPEATACEICDRPAPPPVSNTNAEAENTVPVRGCVKEGRSGQDGVDVALDAAIQSVCCPICLEVYHAPMTLPCGHSLCLHHCPHMQNRECPICRAKFTSSQWRSAKNAALCRNVRTVVLLGSLQDPDRDTIRNAREKMCIGEEELSALKSALELNRSVKEVASNLCERF